MGTRYAKIVKYLGLNPVIHDIFQENLNVFDADLIIDACPTNLRNQTLLFADRRPKKKFLCEKPFCNGVVHPDLPENIRMINQYEYYLAEKEMNQVKNIEGILTKKETVYDYFRSGKDGLIWDCINIVGLSDDDSDISLRKDSLIWRCSINNYPLDIAKMDVAYIWNVYDWLTHLDSNKEYFIKAHQKCLELYRDTTHSDSNTSPQK